MNEQRFTFDREVEFEIFDNVTKKSYDGAVGCQEEICQLLNEQQSTISKQLDQIIELQDKYRILEFNHSRLEKRNKAQYEKIGEQQATINELQSIIKHIKCEENCYDYDYCCETVCSLYKEIKHLKEENEQLKNEYLAMENGKQM